MHRGGALALVTSAELSKLAGVSLSTIHYYTALGLLRARGRAGNRRLYRVREAKLRLHRISRLRQQGYSLALILRTVGRNGA
ncbi:MAG TPA: MerR family transcriptional regulator [bacterium]